MFTGLIEDFGKVESLDRMGGDVRLIIKPTSMNIENVILGDSIAINGICLTVVAKAGSQLSFDASLETLQKTSLAALQKGSLVNLEQAMAVGDRLGGHIVSGHVDTITTLVKTEDVARSKRLTYQLPKDHEHFVAAKGSICIDGVSLTVNEVTQEHFTVNIIPHTWQETIMHTYKVGQKVNIEVDVVARYLARFMEAGLPQHKNKPLSYADLSKL